MPQDPYNLKVDEDTYIIIDAEKLPQGFDSLTTEQKDFVARTIVNTEFSQYYKEEEKATAGDILWPLIFLFAFALVILALAKKIRSNPRLYDNFVKVDGEPNPEYGQGWRNPSQPSSKPPYLTYKGSSLNFERPEYFKVLNKYSCFFQMLNENEKIEFITRLNRFISSKTFFIHDESGYREMPILVSASAIQITFGLEKYMLPAYPHIHIHPEEFLRTNPDICFLQGSVSGHSIFLSWKHFMHGCVIPGDGQHVGLHEMAHAYHGQNFDMQKNDDETFRNNFEIFNVHGKPVFDHEQKKGNNFYSDYALTDFQEFWAESLEIYFERPVEMREKFPVLYDSVCGLLNQDHAKRVEMYIPYAS